MRRRGRRFAGRALALAALVLPSAAQETEPAPTPGEAQQAPEEQAAPPPPEVIPVGSVAVRAREFEADLASARERLEESEATRATIGEEWDELTAEVERSSGRLDETLTMRAHSMGDLGASETRWRKLDEKLGQLEARLGDEATTLGEILEELETARGLWERTLEAARAEEAPANVEQEITDTLEELAQVSASTAASRQEALALQGKDRRTRARIREALAEIAKVKAGLAGSLFQRQEPLIWLDEDATSGAVAGTEAMLRNLRLTAQEIEGYARRHAERLVLQVLGILLLGAYLRRVHRDRRGAEGEGTADRASDTEPRSYLRRPWSAAALVGLFLTPFLHPERKQGLMVLVLFGALLAWVRVLRGEMPRALQRVLSGLALLALAELLRVLLGSHGPVARWFQLATLVVGLVGAVRVQRPAMLDVIRSEIGVGVWFGVVRSWLRLLVVAFGVAVLAAILGYAQLADNLGVVSIWGTVVGVAFLAITQILERICRFLVDSGRLDFLHMVRVRKEQVLKSLGRVIRFAGFAAWVFLILRAEALLDPVVALIEGTLAFSVGYGNFRLSVGELGAFVLTLYLSFLLARFVAFALHQEVFSRVRTPPGIPFAIATFTRYAIMLTGFMLAISTLGFPLTSATIIVSGLGVGIGFGLQNVVNNFVSGMILLFERPIRVGDRIQIGTLLGHVTTIGIRATKVKTFEGSEVIVPNGDLVQGQLVNWTLSDRQLRTSVKVGVAYGTDPQQMLDLLLRVAGEHEQVLKDPEPMALFTGFGDSSLDFELRVWADSRNMLVQIQSDLSVAIHEALADAGIEIPFPQRDLHIKPHGGGPGTIEPVGPRGPARADQPAARRIEELTERERPRPGVPDRGRRARGTLS